MKEKMTKLLTVKSIVTIVLTVVFAVLALTGVVTGEQFLTVFTVVISFYFGTQHEKNGEATLSVLPAASHLSQRERQEPLSAAVDGTSQQKGSPSKPSEAGSMGRGRANGFGQIAGESRMEQRNLCYDEGEALTTPQSASQTAPLTREALESVPEEGGGEEGVESGEGK